MYYKSDSESSQTPLVDTAAGYDYSYSDYEDNSCALPVGTTTETYIFGNDVEEEGGATTNKKAQTPTFTATFPYEKPSKSVMSWPERLTFYFAKKLVYRDRWLNRSGLTLTLFPELPNPEQESKMFYDPRWWRSYDMVLSLIMTFLLAALIACTIVWFPALFTDYHTYWAFWANQLFKMFIMLSSSYAGGLLVLCFGLRMNYTRKIQHFAAYLVPLIMDEILEFPYPDDGGIGYVIAEAWGYYAVMLSFSTLIYPIRTRIRLIDIMFIALDRPEDRPHTLQWMTTQVIIGDSILVAFKWFFKYVFPVISGLPDSGFASTLVFIPTIIVGVGDGLAEPVGITWGYHKYKTKSCACDGKEFTRSYEGSATVLIVGWITSLSFYTSFLNWHQYLASFLIIPITMTIAEAISPHTWDTPLMMSLGCGLLIGICFIP